MDGKSLGGEEKRRMKGRREEYRLVGEADTNLISNIIL